MKNIRIFCVKNCHFLVVKFSVYLNRRVFVMINILGAVPVMPNLESLRLQVILARSSLSVTVNEPSTASGEGCVPSSTMPVPGSPSTVGSYQSQNKSTTCI